MSKGFTLAEVLITLGIIGIVAAMTLPMLIQKQQEKIAVTQLKKTYTVFSQAYFRAVEANGPAESWNIGSTDSSGGAQKLYNIFKPYLLKVKDCNLEQGCFYDGTYKSLNEDSHVWQPSKHSAHARGVLADGVPFAFWSGGDGCLQNFSASGQGKYSRVCGSLHVDINGYKNPNRAGVDYFSFHITKWGVIPAGGFDYKAPFGHKCVYNDKSNVNGLACTAWVIANGNMDYLRRDISSEWK